MGTILGNLLHRLSCALAAALLTWAMLHGAALMGLFGPARAADENLGQIVFSCLAALAAWLFGRSCRYLLAWR